MKAAFLTGVTGFLGGHLVRALEDRGWEVRSACRHSSDACGVPSSCRLERLDMMDPGAYAGLMEGVSAVFHLAGATSARSAEAFHRDNAGMTACVLEARARHAPGALFVLASSQSAAGPSGRPVTPYGRSKLLAEMAVRRTSGWVIVRPPAVFGPGDEATLPVFRAALKGWFAAPMRRGSFGLVFAPDLAGFMADLPERAGAVGRTLEPSYGRPFTWAEFRRALQAAAGRRVLPLRIPGPLVLAAGWASSLRGGAPPVFDLHKAREFLCDWPANDREARVYAGWEPRTPFDQAVRITTDWARQRL